MGNSIQFIKTKIRIIIKKYIMKFLILNIFLFCFSALAKEGVYIKSIPQKVSSDPTVSYGQLFIKETIKKTSPSFKVSIFSGYEIMSPYINSSFIGVEIKHKINSLLYLGMDYSVHNSKINAALNAITVQMDTYGLDLKYPFVTTMVYLNWYYYLLQSHLNFAGLFKVNMGFPIQLGVGFMNVDHKDMLMTVKWGIGPRVNLSPRWSVKVLLFQSVDIKKFQYLYTWYSVNLIYNFIDKNYSQ